MKIDIRDEVSTSEIHDITFATKRDSCSELEQIISSNQGSVIIDCVDNDSDSVIVRNSDIPNLIKALQRVCELRGIK